MNLNYLDEHCMIKKFWEDLFWYCSAFSLTGCQAVNQYMYWLPPLWQWSGGGGDDADNDLYISDQDKINSCWATETN
jgi:hypothetical protein